MLSILLLAVLALGAEARAQTYGSDGMAVSRAVAPIKLIAILPSSASVSIPNVHLELSVKDPNVPTEIQRVPVTSSWHLDLSSTAVELVAYFSSTDRALVNRQEQAIPSSHVEAALEGQPLKPFTETTNAGPAKGSRLLYHQALSRRNLSASRDDIIEIRVDRVSDLGIPAGVYDGTLCLRMVAY